LDDDDERMRSVPQIMERVAMMIGTGASPVSVLRAS